MNEKREESSVKWIQAIHNDVGMAKEKEEKKDFQIHNNVGNVLMAAH